MIPSTIAAEMVLLILPGRSLQEVRITLVTKDSFQLYYIYILRISQLQIIVYLRLISIPTMNHVNYVQICKEVGQNAISIRHHATHCLLLFILFIKCLMMSKGLLVSHCSMRINMQGEQVSARGLIVSSPVGMVLNGPHIYIWRWFTRNHVVHVCVNWFTFPRPTNIQIHTTTHYQCQQLNSKVQHKPTIVTPGKKTVDNTKLDK